MNMQQALTDIESNTKVSEMLDTDTAPDFASALASIGIPARPAILERIREEMRSDSVNFQRLSGSSRRASSRFFCSSLLMCRKNVDNTINCFK
jgi:hypothetical protein